MIFEKKTRQNKTKNAGLISQSCSSSAIHTMIMQRMVSEKKETSEEVTFRLV